MGWGVLQKLQGRGGIGQMMEFKQPEESDGVRAGGSGCVW